MELLCTAVIVLWIIARFPRVRPYASAALAVFIFLAGILYHFGRGAYIAHKFKKPLTEIQLSVPPPDWK